MFMREDLMKILEECHKSYMEMLKEKLEECCEYGDDDYEWSYGKPMGIPESEKTPPNAGKMIAQVQDDDEYESSIMPNIYLNIHLGGK